MTVTDPRSSAPAPTDLPVSRAEGRGGLAREFVTYALVGSLFGIVLVKSEVISWYRIQEMFRFHSFHMYGILGSAMLTAALSLWLLRLRGIRARTGETIVVPPKTLGRGRRYWIGGGLFGIGWALTGACPGPLFALVGSGATVFAITAAAALLGTWTYGYLRPRLPH